MPPQPTRAITDDDAQAIADHMTDKLIDRLSDPKTVDQISGAWGDHIDRVLGRGLRRLGAWVLMVLIGIAALKFDLLAKFAATLKP